MPKPEWGTKRLCHSCTALYYDFNKPEPVCPKCGAVYAPENTLKTGYSVEPAAVKKPEVAATEDDIAVLDDDDEEESYIEDPEELGDDGDMIDVASDEREDS